MGIAQRLWNLYENADKRKQPHTNALYFKRRFAVIKRNSFKLLCSRVCNPHRLRLNGSSRIIYRYFLFFWFLVIHPLDIKHNILFYFISFYIIACKSPYKSFFTTLAAQINVSWMSLAYLKKKSVFRQEIPLAIF